jgi:hypothetical protein
MEPDPTFAFSGVRVALHSILQQSILVFWIMITFYSLLTSLFCISKDAKAGGVLSWHSGFHPTALSVFTFFGFPTFST